MNAPATKRRGRPARTDYAVMACKGAYAGTEAIVQRLIAESKFTPAWRPVRAAALLAAVAERTWMTSDQFRDFLSVHTKVARQRKVRRPLEMLGMGAYRKLRILSGEDAPTKLEALACAHYGLGLEPPIEPGIPRIFADWVTEHFGAVDAVSQWLGVSGSHIADRMRGFDIRASKRVERLPDEALIRALDWVVRMGPCCPYGEPPAVQLFPKGER